MTRPSTDLLKRLFAVRKQIGALVKNKTADAGKYSYDYISLNLIIMQDDILFENGVMFTDVIDEAQGVLTTLYNLEDTNDYIQSVFPWDTPAHGKDGIIDGLSFQDNGKTVTYGTRYNRLRILGLPQDDADTEKPVERKAAKGSKTSYDAPTANNTTPW
jgi:hypothetical protein